LVSRKGRQDSGDPGELRSGVIIDPRWGGVKGGAEWGEPPDDGAAWSVSWYTELLGGTRAFACM